MQLRRLSIRATTMTNFDIYRAQQMESHHLKLQFSNRNVNHQFVYLQLKINYNYTAVRV